MNNKCSDKTQVLKTDDLLMMKKRDRKDRVERDAAKEIYCICRTSDVSRFMIGCDKCNEWYHGDCIKITQSDANNIEKFFCSSCLKKYPALKIVYKQSKDKPKILKCGKCKGCIATTDCFECDFCKYNAKYAGQKPRLKCRLRKCLNPKKLLPKDIEDMKSEMTHIKQHAKQNDRQLQLIDTHNIFTTTLFSGPVSTDKNVGNQKKKVETSLPLNTKELPKDKIQILSNNSTQKSTENNHKDNIINESTLLVKQKNVSKIEEKVDNGSKAPTLESTQPTIKSEYGDSVVDSKRYTSTSSDDEIITENRRQNTLQSLPPSKSISAKPKNNHNNDKKDESNSNSSQSSSDIHSSSDQEESDRPTKTTVGEFDVNPKHQNLNQNITKTTTPSAKKSQSSVHEKKKSFEMGPEIPEDIEDNTTDDPDFEKEIPTKPKADLKKKGHRSEHIPNAQKGKRMYKKRSSHKDCNIKSETANNNNIGPSQTNPNMSNQKTSYVNKNRNTGTAKIFFPPMQCHGPKCIKSNRPGSKYCSDECGLKLATKRIFEFLPMRIQQYQNNPGISDQLNREAWERIRMSQLKAQTRLEELNRTKEALESTIAHCKSLSIEENIDNQESEIEELEANIFCVTCGHPINSKSAQRHMEKCFAKIESQTSYGSSFRTNLGIDLFCDVYNPDSQTFCKRLKVLCPEHTKEPKISENEVCGCPLVTNVFKETGKYCLASKRKCVRHLNWEKLRRAEIDMEKVRQLLLLDDLFEEERQIRSQLANRASVLGLILHQTIMHNTEKPILDTKRILQKNGFKPENMIINDNNPTKAKSEINTIDSKDNLNVDKMSKISTTNSFSDEFVKAMMLHADKPTQ